MEKRVRLLCRGRGFNGEEVLPESICVVVSLFKRSRGAMIETNVRCLYNTGAHGQRCMASHPDKEKVGAGVLCPFSFDHPYVLEFNPEWRCPKDLEEPMNELLDKDL